MTELSETLAVCESVQETRQDTRVHQLCPLSALKEASYRCAYEVIIEHSADFWVIVLIFSALWRSSDDAGVCPLLEWSVLFISAVQNHET